MARISCTVSPGSGAHDYVDKATVTASSVAPNSQPFTPLDFRHWNDDMMQSWTFVVERELGKNTTLRASYIGNHAATWSSAGPGTMPSRCTITVPQPAVRSGW